MRNMHLQFHHHFHQYFFSCITSHNIKQTTCPQPCSRTFYKFQYMTISTEQYRVRVGCYNNVYKACRFSIKCYDSNYKSYKYNIQHSDSNTNTNRLIKDRETYGTGPTCSLLGYIFIVMINLTFSMLIDLSSEQSNNLRFNRRPTENDSVGLRLFINLAYITLVFILKAPRTNVCVFYLAIKMKRRVRNFSPLNFWYNMFLRDTKTCFYYMTLINLMLIVITNPNIVNPGPETNTRPLTIFYNNVQGLITISSLKSQTPRLNTTKMYELQAHIYKNRPDIVVLNETWLKKNILDSEIIPESYKIFRVDRTPKTHPIDSSNPKRFRENGGGVLIAHRTDLNIESTQVMLKKVQAEILTVRLKLSTGKILCISTFYRVGTLGSENFECVKDYLVTLACKRRLDRHILIGDLNFSEIVWPDTATSVELHRNFLKLLIDDLGHSQLISNSTHKNGNILDLMFTNIPELVNDIAVLGYKEACSSDHFGVKFKVNLNVSHKKTVKREVYNYKKADWKSFNYDIKKMDWNYYIGRHDPHMSWLLLKDVLHKLCEKYIPKKVVKYQFQPPWFDDDCEKVLREKEKWRAKANSETGTEEDHNNFRKSRKKFKKVIDEKMRLNVEDDSDPSFISKKFWKHVKSKTKSSRIPETVWYNDKFRTQQQDQANLFNEFFYAQFSSKSNYNIDIDMKHNDRFFDLKFHELDVLLLLREINPNKAAGPDGLHGMVLKNCAASLAKPLTAIFNISFVTGIIPDDWRLASIVPIHKKDEKGSVKNYRPVSLTSLIMKIFERCIKKELLSVCENKIDPRQHGFMTAKSCTTQMVPFIHDLEITLNNKSKADIIYFDFAKAFDSVSHDIILHKLKYDYEVDGLMLRFLRSYLQGRQQQVVVGGFTSTKLPVLSGVPQGSILGPLLFVLFINDMFSCVSYETNIALYADDTKIWREINYSCDHFALQSDIDKLYDWSVKNKMMFHPSKCKVLSVTNQHNILYNLPCTIFNYKLNSSFIDYVGSQIDLGVTINTKLNWNEHCNKLVNKANSQLGLLMRTCHFTMDKRQKKTFYLTIVRSIFEHCSIVWRPKSCNQISKFDAIQKRAIKWINGQSFEHYSDLEYINKQKGLSILPIKMKFILNDLVLFYKIINSLVNIKLPEHFAFKEGKNLKYTRQNVDIIEQNDKTSLSCNLKSTCDWFRNSFFYRTMKLWNSVPYTFRPQSAITKLKSEVSELLLSADLDWPD